MRPPQIATRLSVSSFATAMALRSLSSAFLEADEVAAVETSEGWQDVVKLYGIYMYLYGIHMVVICIYMYLYGIHMVFICIYMYLYVFIWYLYGIYMYLYLFICIYIYLYVYNHMYLFVFIWYLYVLSIPIACKLC